MIKQLIAIIIGLIILPTTTLAAFTVPWISASTTQGWIFPNRVNGVEQNVRAETFTATSTTATSTLPNIQITNGNYNGDYITDFTGSGLKIQGNSLTAASTTGGIYINVKDYGALGDGSTDDTAAINRALTIQQNASTTAILFFPAGKYKYTGTIEPARRLIIKGISGAENFAMSTSTYRSEIEFQNDNQAAFILGSTSPSNTSGRTDGHSFEDIYISNATYQEGTKTSSAAFEMLDNSKSHRFHNIGISKFAYGFKGAQDEIWQNDLKNITINSFSISCIEAYGSITNITVDQFYCRNTFQGAGETPPTANVTNMTKSGSIITATVTSVPYEFQVGRAVYVQDTSLNTGVAQVLMFINATTSTTIELEATSSDPLPGSDYVGRLTMDARPIVGPAMKLGGIWSFRGLDIEHIISSSTEIIYLLGGTVSINDINLEQIYFNNITGRLFSSASGMINVHAAQYINSGIGPNQSVSVGYNNSSYAGVRIEQLSIRDIYRKYATGFTPGRANTNAPDVYVGYVLTPPNNRGAVNPTFTSMGQTVMPVTTRMSTTTMTGGEAYISTSLGIGSTTPMSPLVVVGEAMAEYFTATSTSATSTFPNITSTQINVGSDYITDFTGSGLSVVNGVLTASGGTGWATTSADYHFDNRLAATTTLNNITTLLGLTDTITTRGTTTNATSTNLFATTASSTELFVGSSVSIGTTSQSARLNIGRTDSSNVLSMGRPGFANIDINFAGAVTNFLPSSGILNIGNSRTDSADKTLRLTFPTYVPSTNSEACAIVAGADNLAHNVSIGGGSSGCKAATNITIYGASGTTTTTGTALMSLSGSSGFVGIGTTSPYAKLSVVGEIVGSHITATTTATNTLPILLTTNATSTNSFATTASSTNLYTSRLSVATTSQQAAITVQVNAGGEALFLGRTGSANNLAVTFESGRTNFKSPSGFFNLSNAFSVNQIKQGLITVGNYDDVTYNPRCFGGAQDTGVFGPVYLGGGFPECLAATSLDFYASENASTTVGSLVMRVLGGGNVGIGTSTPYAKLSVAGQVVGQYFTATSTTASSTLPLIIGTDISLSNIYSKTSAGLDIHALSGAIVANLGVGSSQNSLFYGGVNIDGATRLATSLNGAVQATAGALTAGTLPVASGGTGATAFGQGWVYGSGDGVALAASTSPTVNYIVATSTTASSTFPILESQYALFGNARPLSTDSTVKMEVWGDNNGAVQMGIGNRNSGTAAYNCLFFNNDRANSLVTDYAASCLNSGTYSDTTFGTAMASPSQWSFENTMGQTSFFYSSSTASTDATAFDFYTGGRNTTNLKVRINNSGNMSLGTSTTNRAKLEVVQNASLPAIIVDGGSGGNNLFRFFRSVTNGGNGNGLTLTVTSNNPLFCYNTGASETSAGTIRNCLIYGNTSGNFFISTSTPAAGTITGLEPFMLQNSSGKVGLAGTSTPWGRVSINPTIYHTATDPVFVVGSSTKTDFIISTSGNVGIGTSTTPAENIDLTVSDRVATSTIFIRSQDATLGGRIILEDADGAGCTEVTANNGVLSAKTVTCP